MRSQLLRLGWLPFTSLVILAACTSEGPTAPAATKLTFSVQPSNATGGVVISPPVAVVIEDASGNVVQTATEVVTLALGADPGGGALSGTTAVHAVNGVATFSAVRVDKIGTGYTFTATATGLTAATSAAFDVAVGPAAQPAFTVQPSSTNAGATIKPAIQVTVQDVGGNTVAGFTGNVTITIGANPASGRLSGKTTVQALGGVATFSDLSIDKAGSGYAFWATSGTFDGRAASGPFTVAPGAVATLVVTGLPSSAHAGVAANGVVTAKDSFGNTTPGYTGTVHFTSTDSAAVLPAVYRFGAADGGKHAFTVTLGTEGPQTVTATDMETSAITGAETITVTPPPAHDVFAVGTGGTILHYDGTHWTAQTSGTTGSVHGVWGTSGSNVFAVGDSGIILHYDGTSWTRQISGSTFFLTGVWGSSASDVFAVGGAGTILHYDGTSWTQHMADSTYFFTSVWGSSGSDVFALGSREQNFQWSGRILHYDGTGWTTQRIDSAISLFGIWGSSGHDVFAVGDSILHYDGTTWTAQRISALFGVWGTSAHDVFAVGDYGSILHYDGTSWTLQAAPGEFGTPWEFDGVWGSSATDVYTVGQGGAIWHYDGTSWSEQTRGATGFLWSVWGSSPTK